LKRIARYAFALLPHKLISSLAGFFASSFLSRPFIVPFAKHFRINLDEAQKPLNQYPSLNAFFTRLLKDGTRPVFGDENSIVSPVDGTVSQMGKIQNGTLIQAKGIHYSVSDLIGSAHADRFEGGTYMCIYLSPSDYHRIHSPIGGTIYRQERTPGRLYPVNDIGVYHVKGLFTKNERVTTFISQASKHCAVVKVGAFIVGSVQTTIKSGEIAPGGELGYFQFGSTVILLFDKPFGDIPQRSEGEKLLMGELLRG
jgi:phosphatidylserine decarboxylase